MYDIHYILYILIYNIYNIYTYIYIDIYIHTLQISAMGVFNGIFSNLEFVNHYMTSNILWIVMTSSEF